MESSVKELIQYRMERSEEIIETPNKVKLILRNNIDERTTHRNKASNKASNEALNIETSETMSKVCNCID